MKYSAITAYIGILIAGAGVLLLLPLCSLFFHPEPAGIPLSFALISIAAVFCGLVSWKIFRPEKPAALTNTDAAVIVAVSWIIAVFIGALPFYTTGTLSFIDSIFESMSGWTTTGLTMVNPDSTPAMLLLWRALMQFAGGAGFAVIMLSAIVGALGPGVYEAEARTDHLFPHVIYTARMIVKIYILYFIGGVLFYSLAGMELFDALCHALSGLSTGGFSTHSGSIGHYNSVRIEIVTIFLMLAGTVNFATHHRLLSSRGRKGWRDAELRLMAILILAGTLMIFANFPQGHSADVSMRLRQSVFQTVSGLTGTGYTTVSLRNLGELPLFILVLLMLVEGGTGSTSGGIKQYRVAIIMKSIWWWVRKQFYPSSALIRRNIWRRGELLEIEDKHIQAVAAFIGIYLITYTAGVLIFLAHGFSLVESVFEYASALGTVGLSVGITGPQMPLACKLAQILGMWLGRLEFIAIFHAFMRIGRDIRK